MDFVLCCIGIVCFEWLSCWQAIWVDSGGLGQISQSKDCTNNSSGNAREVFNYGWQVYESSSTVDFVYILKLLPLFQSQCNGLYRPVAISLASATNMLDLFNWSVVDAKPTATGLYNP